MSDNYNWQCRQCGNSISVTGLGTAKIVNVDCNHKGKMILLMEGEMPQPERPDKTKLHEALRAAEQAALHAKAMGQSEINRVMELHYKAAEEHKWQNWANPKAPFNQALQAEVSRMEAELAEEKRLFTQLCGDHEKLAMEAQLLRAELAHWKLIYKDAIGDTSS